MPRRTDLEDDWDEDDDRDEGPIEQDLIDEENDDLCYPCPHCGRRILDESERCPYCEKYISQEDAPPARKPIWFVIGVIACLYVVYRWIVW
jgi:uncharacterized protein (DUF983 family)